MSPNLTTCPNCGHQFDAGEAMQKHLEIELKKNFEAQEKANALKLEELKKQMAEEKRIFEQEEKKKMWAIAQSEAQKRAESQNAAQLQALKEDNEAKQKQILLSQQKELELLKKEQELKNQQDMLKIQLEKQLIERSKEIEENAKKKKDEEFEMVKKEYEKKLETQMNLVNEMKRKAEQGSMQLQGEVQELALESMLAQAFPYDLIEEIKKGQRGADAVQTVINEFGQICGKIIFESKRTQAFGGDWIEKLKTDQRETGAEIAVLVTQVMPKDMDKFGEKEGVWVCGFHEVKSLVFVLREILLRTQMARSVNDNKADKMSILYNFLTSNQFRQQIEAIVEGFSNLKVELDKEKRSMQRIWKEREIQIEKVITNTIDMYGSIKGIAGNAIAPIQYLELPEGEE
ncbi:MAG: DUF2130 domain-containing protein [Cytophagaceae bacterium]|nr:DUF2130 domain-containing protein [Cytophagaceae bacterium]MBK9511631.1 DUF2130 domain-containing protein [Cytophagaceae bacterium]MBK9935032.1 DUF2130 domain-containing protein [Cytophagaceae bacterium]MBL0301475.1 DUF2130 domain-containing protein [Cytophagaceae bacterium]MBL0324296.1 DUF2130 domain-containing protein [Cytophagaceae bacterium]